MKQQSVLVGLIITILMTASVAIVAVNFQLKNDNFTTEAIASPEIQPPLQAEKPLQSQAKNTTSNAATNPETSAATPDSIANSTSRGSGGAVNQNSQVGSDETAAVAEISIVDSSKPADIDGVVREGEYAVEKLIEETGLELYWSIPPVAEGERSIIYFALRSPESGCVGIALDPTGPRLKGGDVLLGYVGRNIETDEPQTFFRDDFAIEETSHAEDQELKLTFEGTTGEENQSHYGTSDILEYQGSINNSGTTTIEFSRYLNTGDNAYDKPIKPESNGTRVQLAFSITPEFNCFQSPNIVQKRINFFTGEVQVELQA